MSKAMDGRVAAEGAGWAPVVLDPEAGNRFNSEESQRQLEAMVFLVRVNLRTRGWYGETQRMVAPLNAARLMAIEALAAELLNTAPEGLSDFPEVAAEAAQSFAALKLAVQDASRRITKARA